MRNQIVLAIKNIRGIRYVIEESCRARSFFLFSSSSGLFTPDEAFEYIVQMQIAKFEEPIMKCVEMVVGELSTLIHEATSKVRVTFMIEFESILYRQSLLDETISSLTTSDRRIIDSISSRKRNHYQTRMYSIRSNSISIYQYE